MSIKNVVRRIAQRLSAILWGGEVPQPPLSQSCKVTILKEEHGVITCNADGIVFELDSTQYVDSEILN